MREKKIVEALIVINLILFVPGLISLVTGYRGLENWCNHLFNLNINHPGALYNVNSGAVWQLLTSMFFHGGIFHLIINMYILYIFGKPLEKRWGGGRFLSFYLFTGIGANLLTLLVYLLSGQIMSGLGASGAIFGVMLAFGAYYPDTVLYLYFAIPIKTKWAIVLFAGLSMFFQISGSFSNIGHLTHLFGFVAGFIYLYLFMRINAVKKMFFPSHDDHQIY